MAMSYQEARRIKNTGLKDLIAQNIVSGQSIGSAIGSSISQSFRAKATGFKEKFDPLNIAKKLTGNIGAAILGRMTGRSQKDISYFAGGRRGNSSAGITQDTDMENMGRALYTNVSEGQRQRMRKGDSVTNVLAKLYNLMKKGYEAEEKRRERTIKDKINEEDEKILRHKELLEAITGMKYTGKASNPAKKEEGGIFDFLKSMFDDTKKWLESQIENLKTLVAPLLEFVGKIGLNILGRLAGLLLSPVGLGLLAAVAAVSLAAWISQITTEYIRENVPDMKEPKSVEEAQNVLALGKEKDIQYYDVKDRKTGEVLMTGRDYLENFIKEKKGKEAEEILKSGDAKKIEEAGGEEKLKQIIEEQAANSLGLTGANWDDNTPTESTQPEQTATQLENVPPRPDTTGGKNKQRALNWDRKYEWTHNEDGTPIQKTAAKPLTSGVEASKAGAGKGMAQLEDYNARTEPTGASFGVKPKGIPSASMAPPMPNPIGEQVQKSISQNNNLLIQEPAPKLITIDNSKSVKMSGGGQGSGIIKDGTVDVRIDDPTLQKLQKQNYRPI